MQPPDGGNSCQPCLVSTRCVCTNCLASPSEALCWQYVTAGIHILRYNSKKRYNQQNKEGCFNYSKSLHDRQCTESQGIKEIPKTKQNPKTSFWASTAASSYHRATASSSLTVSKYQFDQWRLGAADFTGWMQQERRDKKKNELWNCFANVLFAQRCWSDFSRLYFVLRKHTEYYQWMSNKKSLHWNIVFY